MSKITNIDAFKQAALDRLDAVRKEIESGKVHSFAIVTGNDEITSNCWIIRDRPVTLIGEMHCCMADMEYYEIDLRKHREY